MSRDRAKDPPGPVGVRLIWAHAADDIDLQGSMRYVGIHDGLNTFAVAVSREHFRAFEDGRATFHMDLVPGKTQVGVFPAPDSWEAGDEWPSDL